MKSIKNLLTLSAVSVMAVLGTASCAPKDGKIHVKLGIWPATQQTQDIALFNIWKNRFEEDNPEYKIEGATYEYNPSTVAAGSMAKTLPTIFQTWFTEPKMLIANGYIKDITDLAKEVGYYDDMEPFMKKTLEDDEGRLYGIPRDGYGFGMLLNLKTLCNYGIIEGDMETHEYVLYDEKGDALYPETFDELKDWSVKLDEASGGEVKGTMFYGANRQGGWLFSNVAWNFGAELQTIENGHPVGKLDETGVVEALQYIADLRTNDLLPEGTGYVYNDWYQAIYEKIGIAFCGSDVIQNAVTQGSVHREDLAFVPMPAGPHGDRFSLYGGTPFVFPSHASDDEVRGALKFLEYMGRSPRVSEVQKEAMVEGKEVSVRKNTPILPTIRPWTNKEFNDYADELDNKYVNVHKEFFDDFFDNIDNMKKEEVKFEAQYMYELLDKAVVMVLQNPNMSAEEIKAQLTTLNSQFNKRLEKY